MEKIFLSVLNMSLTASFVIAAIMLVRLPLKKAPKIISYALWAVAGFRLVFPFTLESVFSLLPFNSTPIPQDIAIQTVPRIDSGITIIDNAVSSSLPAAAPYASVNPLQIWIFIGTCVWLFGMEVMLIYSFVSIVLLKHRLRGATLIEGNLYEADNLKTPFVIGLFRPKIYIPADLSGDECRYIILHEQTHIKRCDHAVKMFAYLILCLHWFNPLAWAAFWLMGADMEMSCDERVMRELGGDIKNAYSLSLVRVAAGRKILNGSPLAFGEGGMKERIKNILNFRKPSRVIIIASVALVAVLSVGLAVNRVGGSLPFKDLKTEEIASIRLYCIPPDVSIVIDDRKTIEEIADTLRTVVAYEKDDTGREYSGQLVQYTLTMLSGETIEVGAYNPFIIINGQFHRTKYEPCEELNRLGNQLRGDKKSPYQEALAVVREHYPEALEVRSLGDETISYTDPPAPVDVFSFEIDVDDETIICAVSKEQGIFFTYSDGTWFAFTGLLEINQKETTPSEDIYRLIQRIEDGLSIIMSSPLTSSNPEDYINAHQEEYENLTMKYSDGVLDYLLSEFETGNSDGLRGQIMMRMCKEILGPSNNVTDESLSPQEWYRQLSVISATWLPDFKPEAPDGEYGGLIYSAVIQHYSQLADGFTVAAPTVYGAYEEEGKLKIFVTVYVEWYRLYDRTLVSVGGSVMPAAMVFSKDNTGGWELEEYLEVGSANLPDGAYFGDSIQKLCVMPVSGKEIQGLAEKMNTDYSNDARQELLMQNLKEHLTTYGQIGVSLQMPDGSMVKLT